MVQAYDLALVNTFFQKKEGQLITLNSGRNTSVTDYIAINRDHLGRLRNCKVVPEESIACQHKFLIADLTVCRKRETRRRRTPRTKCWRLNEEVQEYTQKVIDYIKNEGTEKLTWAETCQKLIEMAKEAFGETIGGKYREKESWFWNSEVQHAVEEKKAAFKAWQRVDNERDPA